MGETRVSYIQPTSTVPVPNGLTLTQYIQTILVGLSDLPGNMVRPKWQRDPPSQPDVNWLAFGIDVTTPDANSYVGLNSQGNVESQRHSRLEIGCAATGPRCLELYGLIRDGFQIQPNLFTLRAANLGFVEVTRGVHIPDLVNEKFIDRILFSVVLNHETIRIYPIPTLVSASGVIRTFSGDEEYLLDWKTQNVET